MKLPPLHDPENYAGLYIFDFGSHVSVGYTADEVIMLMDSGRFPHGQAYRIYRALPDGTMELELIGRETLRREDGLLFYRHQVRDARRDFDQLVELAEHASPPSRLSVQLAKLQSAGAGYLTAVLFPAEAAPRVSGWLNQIKFDGGDFVRGGSAELSCYLNASPVVIDRHEWIGETGASRTAEEVLATVELAVQR